MTPQECLEDCSAFIGEELGDDLKCLARLLGTPKLLKKGFHFEVNQRPLRFIISGEVWTTLGLVTGPTRYFGPGSVLGLESLAAWERGYPMLSFAPPLAFTTKDTWVYELALKKFKRAFKSSSGERRRSLLRLLELHRVNRQAQEIVTALSWEQRLGSARDQDLYRLLEGGSWVEKPGMVLKANEVPEAFFVLLQAQCQLVRDGVACAEIQSPEVVGLREILLNRRMGAIASLEPTDSAFQAVRISGAWLNRLRQLNPDFDRALRRSSHDLQFPERPPAKRQVVVLAAAPTQKLPPGLSRLLAQAMAEHLHERVLLMHLCSDPAQVAGPGTEKWELPGKNGWVKQCTRFLPGSSQDLLSHESLTGDINVTLVDTTGAPGGWRATLDALARQLAGKNNKEQPLKQPIKLLYFGRTPEDWFGGSLLPEGVELVYTALLDEQHVPALGLELFRARMQNANWFEYLATTAAVTPAVLRAAGERFVKGLVEQFQLEDRRTWPLGTTRARLPTRWLNGRTLPESITDAGVSEACRQTLHRIVRAATGRRVGLALGGGGAYGYVHLALLRKLREKDIGIDLVSGSSFGAVAGAYYCGAGDEGLDLLEAHWGILLAAAVLGPLSSVGIAWGIDVDLGLRDLEQVEIPFIPVVTDADMAVESDVRIGTLGTGTRASSSLPPTLGPTILNRRRLLDGAILALVPVNALRDERADLLITSNAIAKVRPRPRCKNRIPLVGRLMDELSPTLRFQDSLRMLNMLGRSAGESQRPSDQDSRSVVYRAKYTNTNLFGFWNAQEISRNAEHSFEVNEAVARFQSIWRKSLNNPPARVSVVREKGGEVIKLLQPLLFNGVELSQQLDGLIQELAEYLQRHKEISSFILTIKGGGVLAEQRARVVKNILRPLILQRDFEVQPDPGAEGVLSYVELRVLKRSPDQSYMEELQEAFRAQNEEVLRAQGNALARSLVSHANRHCHQGDLELARLLALEAAQYDQSFEAERTLRAILERDGRSVAILDSNTGAVTCMAWNPTRSNLLAVATKDARVRIWDLAKREVVGPSLDQSGGSDQGVRALDWSPDGTRLASVALNKKVKVWDVSAAGPRSATPILDKENGTWDHAGVGVRFSPDGSFVLSRTQNGFALFELFEPEAKPLGQDVPVSHAAWGPTLNAWASFPANCLATSGKDTQDVIVWRVSSGEVVEAERFACEAPRALAWHPEGKALLVAGSGSASIFRPGGARTELKGHKDIHHVSWSTNGSWVLTLCGQGRVRVWSGAVDGDSLGSFHGDRQDEQLLGSSWNPKTDDLVALWTIDTVYVWHVPTWKCVVHLTGHKGQIKDVVWSPEGRYLASASMDGTVRVWEPADGGAELFTCSTSTFPPTSVEALSAWKLPACVPFATGDSTSSSTLAEELTKFLVSKSSRVEPDTMVPVSSEPSPLTFAGTRLEVVLERVNGDVLMRIWDAEKKVALDTISGVRRIARDGSGNRLIISRWAKRGLSLWTAEKGGAAEPFSNKDEDGCWDVAWSPNDERIATACNDGYARVYDVAKQECLWTLKHKAPVYRLAWSPGGQLLATGDDLGNVYIWQLQEPGRAENLVVSVQENWSRVLHLAWSPDGSRLFSGTLVGRWQLWSSDVSGKWRTQAVMDFPEPFKPPFALSSAFFSDDNRHVFAVGKNGLARCYPADFQTLVERVAALPWRNTLSDPEQTRYLGQSAPKWVSPASGTAGGSASGPSGSGAPGSKPHAA